MHSLHFDNLEELEKFFEEEDRKGQIYFVEPYYVKSIIGLAIDGRLIYNYTDMVEELYMEYSEDDSIDDPYTAAVEWVDFNIPKGFDMPHVVYDIPLEGLDMFYEVNGFEDEIAPFLSMCIGLNSNTDLIFDDDLADGDKDKIIAICTKYKIEEPLFY